jgi:hypothetical protein
LVRGIMRRAIATLTVVGCLGFAAPSVAAYYVGKPVAEHYLRVLLHETYGYSNTGVYCQPKRGRNERVVKHGPVLYHRWSCGFYAGEPGDSCKGAISIVGSDSAAGFLYYRHGSSGEAC